MVWEEVRMHKLFIISLTVLMIAGCGQRRFAQFPTGSGPTDQWPTNNALQDEVNSAVTTNIANINGDKYRFGTMDWENAGITDFNGQTFRALRGIKKDCVVDLNQKLKLKYAPSCSQKEGCRITFSVDKSCGMRPLFVIKTKYTKEELAACKVTAYLHGVMALTKELAMDSREPIEAKMTNSMTSGISATQVLGKRVGVLSPDMRVIIRPPRTTDPAKASFIGYLVLNNVKFNEFGVDLKKGAKKVISVYTDDKVDATKICLDDFLQESKYAQDVSSKFIMDKNLLHKIKSKIYGAKGSLRTDGKESIAVFKAVIEF